MQYDAYCQGVRTIFAWSAVRNLVGAESLPLRSHGSTWHPRLVPGPLPAAKSGWPPWLRSLWHLIQEKMHGKSVAFCLVFFGVRMSLKKSRCALSRSESTKVVDFQRVQDERSHVFNLWKKEGKSAVQ